MQIVRNTDLAGKTVGIHKNKAIMSGLKQMMVTTVFVVILIKILSSTAYAAPQGKDMI